MNYTVNILETAEQDILDIYTYVAHNDGTEKALPLLDKIEETCLSLESMPERGKVPEELKSIGVIDYLQILCFSYRIIYQVEMEQVYIYAVLDGRRDMQTLLEKRMLAGH